MKENIIKNWKKIAIALAVGIISGISYYLNPEICTDICNFTFDTFSSDSSAVSVDSSAVESDSSIIRP